jgi:hypothetical protein
MDAGAPAPCAPTDAQLIAHAAWCLARHTVGIVCLAPDTHVLCQYHVSCYAARGTLSAAQRDWLTRLTAQYPAARQEARER